MFKKVRCLTRPTQARQDAPFHGQGRSLFDARSVHFVREHERREERQVCEPEGSAKERERRWRHFLTFPVSQAQLLNTLYPTHRTNSFNPNELFKRNPTLVPAPTLIDQEGIVYLFQHGNVI